MRFKQMIIVVAIGLLIVATISLVIFIGVPVMKHNMEIVYEYWDLT